MKTAEEVKPRSRPRAKRIPSTGGRFRIRDELWALMEPLLPEHKNTHRFGGGRPRVPDRQCADAIFFVLRTGCQWNALSATGLCPSSTAHDRFGGLGPRRRFSALLAGRAGRVRRLQRHRLELAFDGRGDEQGALGGGKKPGESPVDRAKRGTKRSLLVEASGVPVGLCVAGANKNDFKLFVETLRSIPVERPVPLSAQPQHLCLDKGYDFEEVRGLATAFGFVAHIRSRGEEAQVTEATPGQKARRSRGGTHPPLDEPLPQPADPLGQETRELPGSAPLRLQLDYLPCLRVIRIGS
jgi:putative transposase